eukprot:CAMPEP_0205869616 /NCGR_PEP_ID=MMETSP1083-20121108/10109_1 /ASSEMBLY_ACC=CAM_ASM_000430 /TAXON_ID=97485 /ORGANISM="Prymnesium parvum, Strain Texoma1" /LENGTH=343 /DNA_ID=CAMNT_0053231821 /DNA_START=78 /DNA_END=1107 /DNA_ORIENTATION=+
MAPPTTTPFANGLSFAAAVNNTTAETISTDQDEPVVSILEWESSHETALNLIHKFRGMFGPESSSSHRSEAELDDGGRSFSSDLRLNQLRDSMGCFPDQQMLSFVLEGVRLQADVELQTVLVPHLVSLPQGFLSVDKEIRRLRDMNWYDFFSQMPFVPIYLNGQGAVARKLEPDRFRRSTEGGGPRKATYDAGGVRALSLNEAAKLHHEPQHWVRDNRAVFRQWIATKAAQEGPQRHNAPWVAPHCDVSFPPGVSVPPEWQPHTKWPKERKLIQTTNVPKVMGDHGYAELFNVYGRMPQPPNHDLAGIPTDALIPASPPPTTITPARVPPNAAASAAPRDCPA